MFFLKLRLRLRLRNYVVNIRAEIIPGSIQHQFNEDYRSIACGTWRLNTPRLVIKTQPQVALPETDPGVPVTHRGTLEQDPIIRKLILYYIII